VLLSGGGRTLQNFIDLRMVGRLPVEIPIVIGAKANLYGLERAANAKIATEVVDRKQFDSLGAYCDNIFGFCDRAKVDLICLAVPSAALPAAVGGLGDRIGSRAAVLLLTKGLTGPLGQLPSEYVGERIRSRAIASRLTGCIGIDRCWSPERSARSTGTSRATW